jgi:glycogen operon protein
LEYVRALINLRRNHIVFRRSRFFHGQVIPGTEVKDVTWLTEEGAEMTEAQWHEEERSTLGVLLSGEAGVKHVTMTGEPEPDDTFLLLFNATPRLVTFELPREQAAYCWTTVIDTAEEEVSIESEAEGSNESCSEVEVASHSVMVMRRGEPT